jgi:hypothetical protein
VVAATSCGGADPGSGKGGSGGDTNGGSSGGGGAGGKGGGSGGTTQNGGSPGSGGGGAGGGGAGGGSASGGSSGSGGSTMPPPAGAYFPFKEGNSWTYEVKDTGITSWKTQTIMGLEKVGKGPTPNMMASKLLTEKRKTGPTGVVTDKTESWQAYVGAKLVRYREIEYVGAGATMTANEDDWWDPYKVRIDERPGDKPLVKDLMWDEKYKEIKLLIKVPPVPESAPVMHTDTWKVIDAGFDFTVKAGTLKNCVQLQKVSSTVVNDVGKNYWFCAGVGKAKEASRTGVSTEELIMYTVK